MVETPENGFPSCDYPTVVRMSNRPCHPVDHFLALHLSRLKLVLWRHIPQVQEIKNILKIYKSVVIKYRIHQFVKTPIALLFFLIVTTNAILLKEGLHFRTESRCLEIFVRTHANLKGRKQTEPPSHEWFRERAF